MKNLTDFRKTVETGMDPRLLIYNEPLLSGHLLVPQGWSL